MRILDYLDLLKISYLDGRDYLTLGYDKKFSCKLMGEEKKFITLKEAAKISGYSADYVGQLIRGGKIDGKQVYTNITWMTTADAVLSYKHKGKNNNKSSGIKDIVITQKRLFGLQLNVLKLIWQNFKSAMPVIFILLVSLVLVITYLLHALFYNNYVPSVKDEIDSQQDMTF